MFFFCHISNGLPRLLRFRFSTQNFITKWRHNSKVDATLAAPCYHFEYVTGLPKDTMRMPLLSDPLKHDYSRIIYYSSIRNIRRCLPAARRRARWPAIALARLAKDTSTMSDGFGNFCADLEEGRISLRQIWPSQRRGCKSVTSPSAALNRCRKSVTSLSSENVSATDNLIKRERASSGYP